MNYDEVLILGKVEATARDIVLQLAEVSIPIILVFPVDENNNDFKVVAL